MYIIIMERNPYQWGGGDYVYTTKDKSDFLGTLENLKINIPLPDPDDFNLWAKGYPGYTYLSIKAYEAVEYVN